MITCQMHNDCKPYYSIELENQKLQSNINISMSFLITYYLDLKKNIVPLFVLQA